MARTALATGVSTGLPTALATVDAARAMLNCASAMIVHPSSSTRRRAAAATKVS